MAKLDVKVDVELGPAIKVIFRLVKAFAAGVQAEDVEQAGALAEAYGLIEQHLRSQIPARDPIRAAAEANDGEYVAVLMKNGNKFNGRIYLDKAQDGHGFFFEAEGVSYLLFRDVEHLTCAE